jgi:hypothetical protein
MRSSAGNQTEIAMSNYSMDRMIEGGLREFATFVENGSASQPGQKIQK